MAHCFSIRQCFPLYRKAQINNAYTVIQLYVVIFKALIIK